MDRHLFWIASDATGRKQAATFYVGTAAELTAVAGEDPAPGSGDMGWTTDTETLYVYSSGAWAPSAGMNPTFDTVTVNSDVGVFAGQGGGWDDMLGQIAARAIGAGNADGVFLLMADCHIQTDTINTKNRNYPFYT